MGLWCAQTSAGGWIAMIVLWLVVVGLIMWGLGRLFPTRHDDDARTLLDSRLAAGTIDPETYHEIRSELDRPTRVSTRAPR